MKTLLLAGLIVSAAASTAMANHFGVFSDATGVSCNLGAPGFNPNAAVIEKFSAGSTGSRFKVVLPPGSSFFGFNTPYVPIGVLTSDLSLGYGVCLSGSIVLGTITAVYATGTLSVLPADNFANIIFTDCLFGEYPATGGQAWVGVSDDCYDAVEPGTWGKVKSLYR